MFLENLLMSGGQSCFYLLQSLSMSLILQVFFVCFLAVSCATVSKPEPEALPSSENGENGQKGLEKENVVVKEISQTLTLEKTVDNLYDNAYHSYLNGKY